MRDAILLAVLEEIEKVVADGLSEELAADLSFHPETLTEREKLLSKKLSRIYHLAHGFNDRHSCYCAHAVWREGFVPSPDMTGAPDRI